MTDRMTDWVNQSINQSINQLINQLINQSTNEPILQTYIYVHVFLTFGLLSLGVWGVFGCVFDGVFLSSFLLTPFTKKSNIYVMNNL